MARSKEQETNPANRKISRPEDAKKEQHQGDKTAATRLAVPKARIGGAFAGKRRAGKDETADALKRAAENERRS